MAERILITGGAGFIGSHLADELLSAGYEVVVLDNLSEQVHGGREGPPEYLDERVEFIRGDIRDAARVRRALEGVDGVYHFAAAVGVGQSMYEVERYLSVNDVGTAVLLEALVDKPIRRLVVASSMSIYGEGLYEGASGELLEDCTRRRSDLEQGRWELFGKNGQQLSPRPTPETKRPSLSSVYALSKYDQERLCLMLGEAYGFEAVALRFFNVYGPRQALSNPYTGVLAIFAARYLNEKSPLVFEDGAQRRDFVHVSDVARACRLAMEVEEADQEVFNIGSGSSVSIAELAQLMAQVLGREEIEPQITGEVRVGDIRHCFADLTKARRLLGFEPQVTLEEGMAELAGWLQGQEAADHVDRAHEELSQRGLTLTQRGGRER